MKEEWRNVVINGKENPWYSVSNLGNVRSHLQNISLGPRGFDRRYNPNLYKDLTPTERKTPDGSLSKLTLKFQCPPDFFEDYQYYKNRDTDRNVSKNCSVHELVMGAFRPMDDYPPNKLKDCWNDIPEDAKTWIKQTVIINHIDHDPSNNCVDNLEYVTPRENTLAAVKHYGGNVANKGKNSIGEFIVFTEPKWNPLFQEHEMVVEFYGDKGKKYYDTLVDISKELNMSLNDTFWEVLGKVIDYWEGNST